ncbi:enoyl-CoA hydratase-related protein [Brevibacterium sp. JSBI002]|uniref:enoyl-CoA hydratase-related protein n=1 Tax=Brevibacterium sp. JSBI002 TaxID=2886045 RepID=UPI0022327B11|nr:enoyl-CoA hydratase-related protein [Brevibacterium sp. JSBI002]UZD61703.1 enoyl-CoA hydratase-related protein [Brevibacterium sp. JSBI002]
MSTSVLTEVSGDVTTVTINRPESLNALNEETFQAIGAAFAEAAAHTRAVILTGSERAFSSGADLRGEAASSENIDLAGANRIIGKILDLPIPTIAAVSGPAAGIGCSLALACDYLVMSETSYLMLPFTKIGLMPDGGSTALVAASAGRHRALRLALTGEKLQAADALDWGLASEVVPAGNHLDRAGEVAAAFAQGPTRALAASKRAINRASLAEIDATFDREVEGQDALRTSKDFAEGVAAFLGKRAPGFTGE